MWYEITYDAYGVHTLHIPGEPNNSLAQGIKAFVGLLLTPQLYRGYVYSIVGDMYTYYLGSRYYVPQFCRFFNADKHSDTQTGVLATNMFAYCNNNPVMYVDPTGEALEIIDLIKTILNAIKNIVYTIKGLDRSIREFLDDGALTISKDFNEHNTASISINLEYTKGSNMFSDVLLYFYYRYADELFTTLTEIILDNFYDEINRNSLFISS